MGIGAGCRVTADEGRYDDRRRWQRGPSPTVVRLVARRRPGTFGCWDVWEVHADGAERVHLQRVTGPGARSFARGTDREIEGKRARAQGATGA